MLRKKFTVNLFVFFLWGVSFCAFGFVLHKYQLLKSIKSYWSEETPAKTVDFEVDTIRLNLSDSAMQVIAGNRDKALAAGKLLAEYRDNVLGKISHKGKQYIVDLRLKGDWRDHWEDEKKWSFKIKVKNGKALMGMKKFNLQRPFTRGHLNEWVFHHLLKYNDLIHLRYKFVYFIVNNVNYGVYALEEHFDKRLVENNNLREGPIFKLDTDMYWYGKEGIDPELIGSPISPYGIKRNRDPELYAKFMVVKDLFQLFKEDKIKAKEIFDLSKMGRYMALIDLFGHYHANGLDNLKFYFNPVSFRIEPIGYDQSQLKDLHLNLNSFQGKILGQRKLIKTPCDIEPEVQPTWMARLFADQEFYEHYVRSCEEISTDGYFDAFFDTIRSEMKKNIEILKLNNPSYSFNGETILKANATLMKNIISPELSVHAYIEDTVRNFTDTSSLLTLGLANVHSMPVKINFITYKDSLRLLPSKCNILQASSYTGASKTNRLFEFEIPPSIKFTKGLYKKLVLNYAVLGSSKSKTVKLQKWSQFGEGNVASLLALSSENLDGFNFIQKTPEGYRTVPGNWVVSKTLIIPKNTQLFISKGTSLTFENNATLISYSPIHSVGSSSNPVQFKSDGTAGGIIVINTESPSSFRFTQFLGLKNFQIDNWSLTGAVNFYEAGVNFSFCDFADNKGGDDLLNIFRSSFEINDCTFRNTAADAFDGDFVRGGLANVTFENIGNDGIDFSGSFVSIKQCSFNLIQDKAISAGERSSLNVVGCHIKKSELAITSKDDSEVRIQNSTIEDSKVGYVAFEKKSEFGPGFIHINNCSETNLQELNLVEKGSILVRDGKVIEPNKENVKAILYGNEYGKSSR